MFPSLLKTLLTQGTKPTHLGEKSPKIPATKTTVMPLPTFTIEIICRICFKGYASGCLPLSSSSGFLILETIEKVLKNVIPEMNMNLIKDSSICITCWKVVAQFSTLKVECLQNERNFYEFLAKNGQEGDINVFVKQERVDGYTKTQNETAFTLNDCRSLDEDQNSILSNEEKIIIDDGSEATVPLENTNEKQNVVKVDNEEDIEKYKLLSCSSCQAECRDFKAAIWHTSASHGVHSALLCKYCSTFYMDSESLKEHLLKSHNKNFSCVCGETFISKQLLTKHIKHHPECVALKKEKDLKCPFCNLLFEERKLFNKHKRTHTRNLYTCEICGKSHASNKLLEEHRFIHSNIKRFMCEKCGQCFKQKSLLWWHNYKKHMDAKNKQCSYCPKKFYRTYDLKVHENVHTKEKRYECHVCSKRFTQAANVRRHMVIHTGEKLECNICGRTYSQRYDLKRHLCVGGTGRNKIKERTSEGTDEVSTSVVKIFHERKEMVVKCEICNRSYKKSYIKCHIRSHTGEKPKVCEVCGKAFASQASLGRHKMIHTGRKPYKCDECNCGFIQKGDYNAHVRRKHTGERPYECKVCNKGFIEFSVLRRHRKTRAHQLAVEGVGEILVLQ